MATGEVILSGTPFGTAGTFGTSLANLFDGDNHTTYTSFPLSQSSMGIDAGAPCVLTRIRLSPAGGAEDRVIGAQIQGNTDMGFTQFSFVQGQLNAQLASGFLTCTLLSPNTASNCLVVFLLTDGVFTSITDTATNSYTQITSAVGNTFTMYAFLCSNIANSSSNTVTTNLTGGTYSSMMVAEYTGVVTSSTVDAFSTNAGSSGTSSTVSCTTTNNNDVLLCATAGPGVSTIQAGTGYTQRISYAMGHQNGSGNSNSGLQDRFISTTGLQTATASWMGGGEWQTVLLALKATVGSPTTLLTISSRAVTGKLFNEYPLSSPPAYRYYRYLAPSGSFGDVADIDFLTTYTAGVIAQCCTPTISPPGGDFDEPIVVRLACITTDAVFYYTLDGTSPTTGSTLYTGPFVISTNCTLSVIATSVNVSNSRIVTSLFHVPSAFVSTDPINDNRNYPTGFCCTAPDSFYDPIGKWWWMYGMNLDQTGVFTHGYIGNNIYKSPDLRNWTYVGVCFNPATSDDGSTNSNFRYRSGVLYNVLTSTYVWWVAGTAVTEVWTAPTPSGPFTVVATFTTILSLQQEGDTYLFLDPADGVTAYLIKEVGSSDTTIIIARLTPDYRNVDGVHFVSYSNSNSSPFGQKSEGYSMFYNNGHYFWMASGYTIWQPNKNLCVSNTTGPLGSWGAPFNPFQNVSVPQTAAEIAIGTTPTYLIAYDSQNSKPFQIPGRNAFIWTGDRYDTGLNNPTFTSMTANFYNYRRLTLPMVFPTPSTVSITWNNNWSLDGTFPTISGSPTAPTGLSVTSTAHWTNNETGGYALYIDNSNTPDFATVISEVLPYGTTTFTITAQPGTYYRIRTVNASGTSLSNIYPTPPPPVIPPATTGSPYGKDPYYDILLRSILRVKNTEALTYPEQTQTEPHSLTHGISPANDVPPEFQNEYVKLYILAEYKYRV